MSLTLFFLRFYGMIMLMIGCSVLIHAKHYARMVHEMHSFTLPYYIGGILALMLGLFVVIPHNDWSTAPAIVVTVIGWLSVVKGAIILLFPGLGRALRNLVGMQYFTVAGVIAIAAGAYMSWVGFM